MGQRIRIDVIGEPLALDVDTNNARQMRLADRTVEANAGAAIGKRGPVALAAVLSIESDRPVSRLLLQ
jgi:hypothetical protein